MSKRDEHTIEIKDLLGKYVINRPLSKSEKKLVIKRMSKRYKQLLKTTGQYTLLTALSASLYFFFKKIGVMSLITKSVISILTISTISGSAYYIITNTIKPVHEKQEIYTSLTVTNVVNENIQRKQHNNNSVKPDKQNMPLINYTLILEPFTSTTADSKTSKAIMSSIQNALITLKGDSYIIQKTGNSTKALYKLTGSIEQIGDSIVVIIKIINTETSTLVLIKDATLKSTNEIEPVSRAFAEEITKKIDSMIK